MHLASKKTFNDYCLALLLLFSVIYNSQFSYLRLIFILLLGTIGILLFLTKFRYSFVSRHVHVYYSSILWVMYIPIWLLLNLQGFKLNINGANVEMLSPVLFLFLLYIIPIIENYNHIRLRKSVEIFLNVYMVYLLFDVIYRYYLEPGCFLNYSCRYQAKTVGMFSTTNALASSLVVVILALILHGRRYRVQVGLLILILITTMARAAIVGFLISLCLYLISNFRFKARMVFVIALTIISFVLFANDPFAFRGDGSALSKIDFLLSAFALFKVSEFSTLIFGFGSTFDRIVVVLGVNGWSPHLPLLKSFLYFGIIGVVLYVYHILSLLKLSSSMIFVMIGYLILSFAGAPIFFPSIVAVFAILKVHASSRKAGTSL